MNLLGDNAFSLPETRRLLALEWALAQRQARSAIAGPALSIGPREDAAAPQLNDRPHLSHLYVRGQALCGDFECAASALPWTTDSASLLIVRHALELLPADSGLERELTRVLAPGGTLVLFGLNPLSTWRLWWLRQSRSGVCVPRFHGVAHVRRRLEGLGLATGAHEFLGGNWPLAGDGGITPLHAKRGARWHGAWMLVARKSGVSARPIPLRSRGKQRAALGAGFAQPANRRASA